MPIPKKRAVEIAKISDEDIDTADIPVVASSFFHTARLVQTCPELLDLIEPAKAKGPSKKA